MATDFGAMTHEEIFKAVHVGVPGAVGNAASQLAALNTTISGHLDVLDKLSTSMAQAWPDENGQNFRATLSHTIGYLRDLQATHITTAGSSVTQVMSASHEKLSSTQHTIPTPPATPVAQQEAELNQESTANGGAMNEGMVTQTHNIAAAKADDAKAVTLAKSLANTYLAEKAKLTNPPAAPNGPSGSGSGSGSSTPGSGSGSSTGSTRFASAPDSGSPAAGPGGSGSNGGSVGPVSHVPDPGTGGTGGGGTGGSGTGAGNPVGPIGGVGSGHGGAGGAGAGDGTGSGVGAPGGSGSNHGGPSSLLDPGNGMGAGAGSPGGLPGTGSGSGSGTDGFGGLVPGLLGGAGAATLGGLGGAGVIAARKAAALRSAEQAALLRQEEEAGADGSMGGGGTLSASQLAAINAQRNGVLTAGEEAGLMNSERNYMAMQQRTIGASSAAMAAQEEAALGAGQPTVAGQLGGTPVAAGSATGARAPFSAGGVVGGAERVTWLVEDRDLWSADPGVRAVIQE